MKIEWKDGEFNLISESLEDDRLIVELFDYGVKHDCKLILYIAGMIREGRATKLITEVAETTS